MNARLRSSAEVTMSQLPMIYGNLLIVATIA